MIALVGFVMVGAFAASLLALGWVINSQERTERLSAKIREWRA